MNENNITYVDIDDKSTWDTETSKYLTEIGFFKERKDMYSFLLKEVKNVEEKQSKNGRPFIRVTFLAWLNDEETTTKMSMSINQWEDLKKAMSLSLNEKTQKILTETTISCEFKKDAKTNSDNPKLLASKKVGNYNGYPYNYWEINVGALIENKILQSDNSFKNYSKLFKK